MLKNKVSEAIARIQKWSSRYGETMYLGHSGGKDSCVITDLVLRAERSDVMIVHNPKPETHPETVKFLYEFAQVYPIVFVPPIKMGDFVEMMGFDAQLDGSRRAEHNRTERSTDIIIDGKNVSRERMKSVVEEGIFGLTILYPIYDWTDDEVWEYIETYKVRISDEYKAIRDSSPTRR